MTSNNLKQLYGEGCIDVSFKINLDSVRYFVDQKKSEIQYKGHYCSKKDAETALRTAKQMFERMKKELA